MALELSSPAFDDGDPIPEEYGYEERNVNPPLRIDGVPEAAESLALLVDDPDAVEPAGQVWDHWVVYDVPPRVEEIPEDWDVEGEEGRNDYGEAGYGGPNPPDAEHDYRFRLYALDERLELGRGAAKDTVEDELEDSVLARDAMIGTYAP